MKSMNILKSFIILSFVALTSVSANNINSEQISPYLEAIQLFALKEKKMIFDQNKLFSTYDTFIDSGNDFHRYYIVNVKSEDFEQVLSSVKKEYPTAFKASQKIATLIKHKIKQKPKSNQRTYISRVGSSPHCSVLLNSETILKTRKKFF